MKRCICHEHRHERGCEDNPESAFVSRGAQIAGAVLGVPLLVIVVGVVAAVALLK